MNTPKPSVQNLLFSVTDAINDQLRQDVHDLVAELANKRDWTLGPPIFVNETDDVSMSEKGDVPIETLGGYLKIHSAWTEKPSRAVDIKTYDDVIYVIDALREFSKLKNLCIEFELDGMYVGEISSGHFNRNLSVGLLNEWARHLG